MFSSSSFTVSGLTFKCFIHFELTFFMRSNVRDQFHSSASGLPVFSTLLKRSFSLHCVSLAKCVDLFLDCLFVPLAYVSIFMPVPCSFDCYGFEV